MLVPWALIAVLLPIAADAACTSDFNCSLNGRCVDSVCECVSPWQGPTCGILKVLAVDAQKQPGASIYGWNPNVSSWGSTLIRNVNGTDHLFAAQMKTGGLRGWESQSECIHATGSLDDGTFKYHDTALSNECHGPVVIQDPSTKEWLMFHIGDGGQTNGSAFMHHSTSLYGPWTPLQTTQTCGMPSAGFHPNGTLFLVCRNGGSLFRADPDWRGKWTHVATLNHPGGWEDPTLYFDANNNWHIIYHVYSLAPYSKHDERYSGHGYSTDGLTWYFSDVEPFSGTVNFTDGSSKTFSTRERPQLLFGDSARHVPVGMTSAVSSQPIGPWCDECNSKACSQCKVSEGRDWTYSIFQPFEGYTPVPLEPAAALSADANGLVVTEDGAKVTCYTSPASENIKVVDGGAGLEMGFGTRTYLMVTPNLPHSSSKRSDFKILSLLGKEINVTVDLNGASCGCNAAFYLTSMPAPSGSPGESRDWYCDANSVGGNSCPEVDLIECNQNALHTTMHACKKPWNETNCDKGGFGPKFGQGLTNFGIGDKFTIDTTKPFTVSNAFVATANGTLDAVVTTITQGTLAISQTLDSILLERVQTDIGAGMVLVMSYWGASSMGWLDSPPCKSDPVGQCPASITFSDISVSPAPPPSSATSRKCCSWGENKCGPTDYCNGSEDSCEKCGGKWVVPTSGISHLARE